ARRGRRGAPAALLLAPAAHRALAVPGDVAPLGARGPITVGTLVRPVFSVYLRVMYVELHCHSGFSFLDGASHPEELVLRAKELGYPALALTDHDGLYGSMEFAHRAKEVGLQPITGAEVSLRGCF